MPGVAGVGCRWTVDLADGAVDEPTWLYISIGSVRLDVDMAHM